MLPKKHFEFSSIYTQAIYHVYTHGVVCLQAESACPVSSVYIVAT